MDRPFETATTALYLADTHVVSNVSRELCNYNMYSEDLALTEAVQREGAAWAQRELVAFGALTGSADYLELGQLANKLPPELDTHDRFGNRTDLVKFHPAYHQLMTTSIEHGLHASPWTSPGPGGQKLFAHPGRGRPRLSHHHDVCGRACLASAARPGQRVGAQGDRTHL